jgi:methionyl-tRNA formyltransferase
VAVDAGIPVEQPINFKYAADVEQLKKYQADLMVVVAYGLLLPESVLEAPRLGCINIHASLLPRWRGAAPIQRAVLAGDKESGVAIMQMEKGLDTGPVFLMERVTLEEDETGGTLHDKLAELGASALIKALPMLEDPSCIPVAQNDELANYAKKLDKKEATIDWQQSAQDIERLVRAFNPWPVAQTRYEDAFMRIWSAYAIKGEAAQPGMVMSASRDGIDVATGDGLLRITQLQMPGKRAMSAQDFINAQDIQGVILGD